MAGMIEKKTRTCTLALALLAPLPLAAAQPGDVSLTHGTTQAGTLELTCLKVNFPDSSARTIYERNNQTGEHRTYLDSYDDGQIDRMSYSSANLPDQVTQNSAASKQVVKEELTAELDTIATWQTSQDGRYTRTLSENNDAAFLTIEMQKYQLRFEDYKKLFREDCTAINEKPKEYGIVEGELK